MQVGCGQNPHAGDRAVENEAQALVATLLDVVGLRRADIDGDNDRRNRIDLAQSEDEFVDIARGGEAAGWCRSLTASVRAFGDPSHRLEVAAGRALGRGQADPEERDLPDAQLIGEAAIATEVLDRRLLGAAGVGTLAQIKALGSVLLDPRIGVSLPVLIGEVHVEGAVTEPDEGLAAVRTALGALAELTACPVEAVPVVGLRPICPEYGIRPGPH